MSGAGFTLDLPSLIAWLEAQPGETEYDYTAPCGCLLFKFIQASGAPIHDIGPGDWSDESGGRHEVPEHLNSIAQEHPRTYAAALDRARRARGAP